MKKYYIGLYVLVTILLIYWFSTFLIQHKNIENFEEISAYQTDSAFLKSMEGKDMKPKTRVLNLKLSILPQLEGTYQGTDDLKNTYWKIDKNGKLINAYGLYGTITVSSPQKTKDDFIYLNFKDKAGKNYEAQYNGSRFIMTIGSKPFILELIDDPTILPLDIANINTYIGNIKGSDNTQYTISKEGFLLIPSSNSPLAQLSYQSTGPPYQNDDGTYTFTLKYIDTNLQQKFGTDEKRAVLSKSELNIYDMDDKLLISYKKVLPIEPPKPAPVPTIQFGFTEVNAPVLEGCTRSSIEGGRYYDTVCINRSYYIINYDQLLCLSVASDGKTLVMQSIDKNNPKQIWIPRQYRIEDRYNYYDHPWCQADFDAEEQARSIKYDELKDRAKWMRPETIYPRNPPKNKILQSKIDYRVRQNNGDFLLENSTSRSFVKGDFNEKTTLLDLSLLPASIKTIKRKGFDFNTPIYENISPKCLYKCNTSRQEINKILESDPYATNQYNRNCPSSSLGNGCINYYDPPCTDFSPDCWLEDWYTEEPRYEWWFMFGQVPVGTRRTYRGKRWVCGAPYCKNDPAPYCTQYACGDTRTQQFNGKYQSIECNDKYDNYGEMTRFRFEGNMLEVITRVSDKYNSLAVKNRQYVQANDKDCLITYSEATTDAARQKQTWYFIPVNEIDRIIPKLKERKRNLPLEKRINENVNKMNS